MKNSVFLTTLERYSQTYNDALWARHFLVTEKTEGPGMGAAMLFSNETMTLHLICDKGQFFLEIRRAQKSMDLSLLLAFLSLVDKKLALNKMSFTEKITLWEINYDYADPLHSFFRHYDQLKHFLCHTTIDELNKLEREYYKDRAKWLFK